MKKIEGETERMHNKTFGVAIVTYNRLKLLKECLESVSNQTISFDKVVVVNNNSSDGTKEYLDSICKYNSSIVVIHAEENLGGAGGFSLAIKSLYKTVDYLLIIDDDAMLDKFFLQNILTHMSKDILAYSGTVETKEVIDTSHRRYLTNKIFMLKKDIPLKEYQKEYFDYDLSTFCGLLINSDIVKKIGLPKSEYFIWYDDTEYSLRIRKYTKIRNINCAKINHKTNIDRSTKLSWKSYYGYRNAIDVGRRFSKNKFLYLLYRYLFHIIRFFQFKIGSIFVKKEREYKNKCAHMHLMILRDSLKKQLGKNEEYYAGYKL